MAGKVYLVGAGPGDPDLLTVKAVKALAVADVVLHDDLVPPAILAHVGQKAAVFSVGKRCGKKSVSQHEINTLMIDYARAGFTVVRLQGGDPLIFGRAGEEIRALAEAGVDFEIVPGVTAALGAAAAVGIALTERRVASSVVFLTAHHCRAGATNPWPGWPSSISSETTLVVYMPGDDNPRLGSELASRGLMPETPCLIVSGASTPAEQRYLTTLAELPQAPSLPSPKLLIVGAVVAETQESAHLTAAINETKL